MQGPWEPLPVIQTRCVLENMCQGAFFGLSFFGLGSVLEYSGGEQ